MPQFCLLKFRNSLNLFKTGEGDKDALLEKWFSDRPTDAMVSKIKFNYCPTKLFVQKIFFRNKTKWSIAWTVWKIKKNGLTN